MKANYFLSLGVKIILPTASNPKVYLAIDNSSIARQSFKLYNPFSKKARILRCVVRFLCVYCNGFAKKVLPTIKIKKSNFARKLESKLKKKIHSSVYVATARDKFVVQLQNNGEIIGYLKVATTSIGEKRLLNEKKAIDILSNLDLVPKILSRGNYKKKPYIILENLKGSIGRLDNVEYKKVLDTLKKVERYKLSNHPRVQSLIKDLDGKGFETYSQRLKVELKSSKKSYVEVFEHGDFAPWNLIKVENKLIPFDFEYFEEKGLEYLDEVKYHFQINHLLKKKSGSDLLNAISSQINIAEFKTIFLIFLLKEVVNKEDVGDLYDFEISLINLLTNHN